MELQHDLSHDVALELDAVYPLDGFDDTREVGDMLVVIIQWDYALSVVSPVKADHVTAPGMLGLRRRPEGWLKWRAASDKGAGRVRHQESLCKRRYRVRNMAAGHTCVCMKCVFFFLRAMKSASPAPLPREGIRTNSAAVYACNAVGL